MKSSTTRVFYGAATNLVNGPFVAMAIVDYGNPTQRTASTVGGCRTWERAREAARDLADQYGCEMRAFSSRPREAARWTPLEALEQARAALPDAGFAERYSIAPAVIHRISDAIEVAQHDASKGARDVLLALVEARGVLPRAWPEKQPLELFADLDRSIRSGYLELLDQYNSRESVEQLYGEDELFASALNDLIPGFEYPNHSHQTVGEVRDVITKLERKSARLALEERGVPIVDSGRHVGSVVEVSGGFVVQDVGRGNLIAHDLRKCNMAPDLGLKVDIGYAGGQAVVRVDTERARVVGQER